MLNKIINKVLGVGEAWRRRKFEDHLLRVVPEGKTIVEGNVLIDASFDNPNYWIRSIVLLRALGVSPGQLVGTLGIARRTEQQRTLKRLGVTVIDDLAADIASPTSRIDAKNYLEQISRREDLLEKPLPYDVPPKLFYDFVLKRQQAAYIWLDDPNLERHIGLYFALISRAATVIKNTNPQLVIVSHVVGVTSPLVWLSLINKIPVLVPFGNNGVSMYWRLNETDEIYDFQDKLTRSEFNEVCRGRKEIFEELGNIAVKNRFAGTAVGLGVRKAYADRNEFVDRDLIVESFGCNKRKSIVGVYASNWFDYPHTYGMKNFADFFDWISCIYEIAVEQDHCNWLFKAHPCDSWYGGPTLEDYFDFTSCPNIRLAYEGWDSKALLQSLDAVITYHGTVGIEATCIKKPVLVSDDGWYTHIGFVKRPIDRNHFEKLLAEKWWEDMDVGENARLARRFAGTYWCRPDWQTKYVMDDDSDKWSIYKSAIQMLDSAGDEISKEQELVRSWYLAGHSHYNAYKFMEAGSHAVFN